MATFKAIRIDKAEKGTTVALTQFDEADLMDDAAKKRAFRCDGRRRHSSSLVLQPGSNVGARHSPLSLVILVGYIGTQTSPP